MGLAVEKGQLPQLTVPGGYLKAARVMTEEKEYARFPNEVPFTLISEAVAPGFDYRDRHVPRKSELRSLYPDPALAAGRRSCCTRRVRRLEN